MKQHPLAGWRGPTLRFRHAEVQQGSTRMISSCRLEQLPTHDRVSVWARGSYAGYLTVGKDEGRHIIDRLLRADRYPITTTYETEPEDV